jgi:hypothetical protein
VDTRSPPGHPLKTTSVHQIRFLRVIYHNEPQEILAACTRLIYVRIPRSTSLLVLPPSYLHAHGDGIFTQHEFYAIQTLYTSREFWDCLIPVLGREKLERYMEMSQSDENKEGVRADIQRAVEEYGAYGVPWFVATRPSDGKRDVFFGADKLEAMAWWLGAL